ncbi:hypothetical protein MKX01_013349 [Papaver californicum]|nr:hypothetical protein MKX01_013349 [Papaver californicum]
MVQKNEYLSINKTLVSSGQTFEFGFFSTNTSKNLHLGIWYNNITSAVAVWVANRNRPLTDSAGSFTIADDGNIVLLDGSNIVIWSSNLSRSVVNPVVQLLESGNLVSKVRDSASYIWQSFDYPTNTLLPGMKLGWDLKIGLNRYMTSWKNVNDPSIGDYSFGTDLAGLPQFVLRNGLGNSFVLGYGMEFNLVVFKIYCQMNFSGSDPSVIMRESMNERGQLQRLIWDNQRMKLNDMSVLPRDQCDSYNYCGCLQGFAPSSQQQWSIYNWTGGYVRETSLEYGSDIFSIGLEECKWECTKNCSCTAYANSDIREGGSGCILWFGDLFDFRHFSDAGDQKLFIKLASSEGETISGKAKKKKMKMDGLLSDDERQKEDLDLPLFDLITIETATNNFSHTNKIGEGGYEIAVKRLSKDSGQGSTEFKNEVILIAKLQQQNLIKLLGCGIQREEKILIYEYMPNESLDNFIFDQKRSKLLDWDKRLSIVMGIAKGLIYLHQDSSLRIVHRDLKASNILLDCNMNLKISDFGMARLLGGEETEVKTRRLVGTYGYMSPEYAIDGHFPVNSDVFSFGVLVLDTISGKKNRGFYHDNHHHNLLGHAWIFWNEGNTCELMEPGLGD